MVVVGIISHVAPKAFANTRIRGVTDYTSSDLGTGTGIRRNRRGRSLRISIISVMLIFHIGGVFYNIMIYGSSDIGRGSNRGSRRGKGSG